MLHTADRRAHLNHWPKYTCATTFQGYLKNSFPRTLVGGHLIARQMSSHGKTCFIDLWSSPSVVCIYIYFYIYLCIYIYLLYIYILIYLYNYIYIIYTKSFCWNVWIGSWLRPLPKNLGALSCIARISWCGDWRPARSLNTSTPICGKKWQEMKNSKSIQKSELSQCIMYNVYIYIIYRYLYICIVYRSLYQYMGLISHGPSRVAFLKLASPRCPMAAAPPSEGLSFSHMTGQIWDSCNG